MLNIPQKISEVYNRIIADFKTYNKKAQPAVKNSWIGSILVAISGRIYDIYRKLNYILKQAFIDTATGEYLKRWGYYVGIYQKSAQKASGNFILTGVAGSIVNKGTEILVDSNSYITNYSIKLAENNIEADSFVQESDLVTITFTNKHNLGTGMTITVNGEDCVVEVIDAYTISISTENQLTSPVIVNYTSGIVPCTPSKPGYSYNLSSGQTGKTSKVIQGVDIITYTDYAGFTGGSDIEDIENLRARIIYRYQHPVTNFNKAAIITFMQSLPNVGNVKVHEITPNVGQVTIYYLLNNNELPTSGKTESILNSIDSDLRPANTDISDIFLSAATPISVNFTIEDLNPLSVSLKNAIIKTLTDYFSSLDIEQSIQRNKLIELINSTVDSETGEGVKSFTLTSPSADISIDVGEFAKLGGINI